MSKTNKSVYPLKLEVNGYQFLEVVISHHYQAKHTDISDELILDCWDYLSMRKLSNRTN